MLGDILRFLINILFTLFGAALLLRAWVHAVRLHPFNPLARVVYQATNWLIVPLRRVIPPLGGIDLTPIVALLIIQGVQGYLLPPLHVAALGLVGAY